MDDRDEVPEDYEIVGEGRRGRFAAMARGGTNLVPVDPDILARFHNKGVVNSLLRELIMVVDDSDTIEPQNFTRFRDEDFETSPHSDSKPHEFLLIERSDGTFAVKKAENAPQLFIERSVAGIFTLRTRDGRRSNVEAATIDDAVTHALRMYPQASIRIELFGNRTVSVNPGEPRR